MQFDAYLAIQNHDFIKKKSKDEFNHVCSCFQKVRIWPIFCLLTKFCALSTGYGLYQAHDTHGNNATACGCFVMLLMDPTRWTWKGKTRARLVWFFYRTLVDVTNRHFSNDQRFLQLGGWGGKANGWCWQLSRSTSWKVSRWWWNEKL